ncbi:hypothetical protein K3N62_09655 [Streptococcus dysgalactiae subsp. dysgalactiae]|uniref:hypothetical protein n=1 Tax=Streptococcus dysgalactiae TaxID=1334 RepID=UPI001CF2BE3D|nr:hypothetical protein [Streptococcus dysgalactiae]MCB2830322.1 hypothetical protein [Streptococcus dysgalactiae subsp. dysgalactiae]MCB2843781.1 hypothetical protein [Streptococcus dysgalactiae subsp. dysgalactiae]MCB2847679.1 hypothetical protein [Streptococcus dysgalactiae subsp. dysgalactiae]MCB2849476.1 hypothetical protein [Streptococcus dysgalactiae subsp. dysgalactiae]MCB2851383.1 hypothetical protein [Streptococcus dysgalactiae subsp. dysgalactiae]
MKEKTPIGECTATIDAKLTGIEEFKELMNDVIKKADELEKAVQRLNKAKITVSVSFR